MKNHNQGKKIIRINLIIRDGEKIYKKLFTVIFNRRNIHLINFIRIVEIFSPSSGDGSGGPTVHFGLG